MGVSTNRYYAWRQAPEDSARKQRDEMLADKAEQIFNEHKSIYGSRQLSDDLKKQGFTVGRFKTRRLMQERELAVRYPKKFKVTTDSNHDETISPKKSTPPLSQRRVTKLPPFSKEGDKAPPFLKGG
ncbi:MAG: IS3 family transposase [Methylococcales bacterium]|nr:IS3 family transposase [Methylococcales bacterium]